MPLTMSFEEATEGLRRGDFSRLAPLFGDPSRPDVASGQMLVWVDTGAFAACPDVLAEALTCACWLGQVGVAAHMLDAGADPGRGTGTGMSALHWAANRGQRAAVELLLSRGAPMEQRSMYDATALGAAVWAAMHEPRGDHLGVIRALLSAGADVTDVQNVAADGKIHSLLAGYRQHGAQPPDPGCC